MGNVDARFGFQPVSHMNGSSWNGQVEKCYVHASYATALYVGDAVDLQTENDYMDPLGIYKSVKVATAGDGQYIYGVITAVEPIRTDLTKQYLPASTGGYVYVCSDPSVIFHLRDDGAAALTKTAVGQNANFITTHGGSTITGLSGMELDTNSDPPEANASNQLFIHGLADLPDNTLAARAIWRVSINLHRMKSTGDGDGALGVTST